MNDILFDRFIDEVRDFNNIIYFMAISVSTKLYEFIGILFIYPRTATIKRR